MSGYDPIPEIVKLGYTPREAAFLYLAGMHSGYFLRRQYNQFVAREDGATSQRLCEKVTERGHAETMDYGQKRFVFHLQAKAIYRLLGIEDSQNRRRKGDREIKARLMQLDYLLDCFGSQFLETERVKVEFFHRKLGVPLRRRRDEATAGFLAASASSSSGVSGCSFARHRCGRWNHAAGALCLACGQSSLACRRDAEPILIYSGLNRVPGVSLYDAVSP